MPKRTSKTGRDLFIVDNSVSGWTGLRYLEEWSGIAKAFDIATGYFEIGALLALDGKWQQLEKIRILMGAETTHRTRKALLEAVRARARRRSSTGASRPTRRPTRSCTACRRSSRRSARGQIECRVYDKDKFHAKAYITHAKLEVVGSQALVGSSNFTAPGPHQERRAQHPDPERPRGRAAPGVVRGSTGTRRSEVTDAVIETIAAPHPALHARSTSTPRRCRSSSAATS